MIDTFCLWDLCRERNPNIFVGQGGRYVQLVMPGFLKPLPPPTSASIKAPVISCLHFPRCTMGLLLRVNQSNFAYSSVQIVRRAPAVTFSCPDLEAWNPSSIPTDKLHETRWRPDGTKGVESTCSEASSWFNYAALCSSKPWSPTGKGTDCCVQSLV